MSKSQAACIVEAEIRVKCKALPVLMNRSSGFWQNEAQCGLWHVQDVLALADETADGRPPHIRTEIGFV